MPSRRTELAEQLDDVRQAHCTDGTLFVVDQPGAVHSCVDGALQDNAEGRVALHAHRLSDAVPRDAQKIAQKMAERDAQAEAEELQDELADAIGEGLLEVEAFSDRVLIRIRERGSFGSGHARLKPEFLPLLKLIADVLNQRDGHFVIAGHTDDIPIETKRFRSNWDLSAARAASVVHFFIQQGDVDPERMEIRALSDNEPIVPNDSWENRAKNRRVEISVLHGNRHAIESESPADNVDYVDPEAAEQEQ